MGTITLLPLIEVLKNFYLPPDVPGGHEITHVNRMVAMGPKIRAIIEFDLREYEAAVWLHNADRHPKLKRQIEEVGLGPFYQGLLQGNGFSEDAVTRIVDAAVQHAKFMDEPGDSTLLTALRIADKLDRFSALGIMALSAHAHHLLPYDENLPFGGYTSTVEGKLKSIYNNCFRVLEWYGMLPSDAARTLVSEKNFCFFIAFLRQIGEEIAEVTGVENGVETDIKKALGKYYECW